MVLDCFVSKRRDKKTALKFLKKLIKTYGNPNKKVTDKLESYGAALRDLGIRHLQETTQYANNLAENSHLHFRRRERGMNRFRSMHSLQKFVAIQATFQNHFNHQRHLEQRQHFKDLRTVSLNQWQQIAMA